MNNEAKGTDSLNQAKVKQKPGPKKPEKQTVTIEGEGALLGRDKVPVLAKEVQKLAALGCTNKDIAKFFGCNDTALSRYFAAELEKGREEVKITLRRAMLENACTKHNAAVQIFLAKNLLGMSDNGMVDDDANKPLPWTDNGTDDLCN